MMYETAPEATQNRAFLFDLVTGLVLTSFLALFALEGVGSAVLSVALTLPWIFRRTHPIPALAVATAAALAQVVIEPFPMFVIVIIPMYVYSFARWSGRNLGRISLGVALVGAALGPARWLLAGIGGGGELVARAASMTMTVVACAGTVTLAYVIGRRRFERAERNAAAIEARVERERLMQAEQEQRARFTVVDERNRIARELHDIVAHSLSVIVVQAEGGRALATKQPERAPEVLGTIADTSRDALQEMRQMVGLLRSGGTPGSTSGPQRLPAPGQPGAEPTAALDGSPESFLPTPGLDDLPELIDKTGDQFTLTEYGNRPLVNAGIGLTVYRIVQESLTNVLKHAGQGARAAVGITYASDGIGIRVVDDGSGESSASQDGSGHGLRGMAERLSVHHGTVDAHRRPVGGFEVLAWLPYAEPTRVLHQYPAGDLTRRIGEQR